MTIRKKFASFTILLTLTVFLVSCGTWVDMPGSGFYKKCTDSEVEKIKKTGTSSMGKAILSGVCKKEGKKYAGDIRCQNGVVQVKCK